jgi:hypothetical protein
MVSLQVYRKLLCRWGIVRAKAEKSARISGPDKSLARVVRPALNWIEERGMSDGREERQEQEQRRQWEQERERDDRLDRYPVDPWRPERRES